MANTTLFLEAGTEPDPSVVNGIIPPITVGMAGHFEIGGSAGRSVINHVVPDTPGAIAGVPVYEPDGAIFTAGSSWLETYLPETPDFTFLAVAKILQFGTSADKRTYIIGNYSTVPGFAGCSLYAQGTDPTITVTAGTTHGTTATATSANVTGLGWRVLMARMVGGTRTVTDFVTGTTRTSVPTGARVMHPQPLRVGAPYTSTFIAPVKVRYASIYNTGLSDADAATMAGWLRAKAVADGIVF